MAAKKELYKGLTEILEQLSKKGVKAQTPSVRASRRALKGERKFEPITGAGSRKPGRKIGEGVPTAGKGVQLLKKLHHLSKHNVLMYKLNQKQLGQ